MLCFIGRFYEPPFKSQILKFKLSSNVKNENKSSFGNSVVLYHFNIIEK